MNEVSCKNGGRVEELCSLGEVDACWYVHSCHTNN